MVVFCSRVLLYSMWWRIFVIKSACPGLETYRFYIVKLTIRARIDVKQCHYGRPTSANLI